MVKHLLFIFLPFISFHSFAESVFRDLLNGTEIRYVTKEIKPSATGEQPFEIEYLVLKGNETPQLTLLNASLKSVAESMWTNPGMRRKFDLYFFESLQYQLANYAAELEEEDEEDPELKGNARRYREFKPEVYEISTEVLSLCNDVLIVSFNIEYRAILGSYAELENEHYSLVRCYDLKTGREIDKRQIIHPSQKWAFESLVKQKIPERFKKLISTEEIEDAELLFSGAAFYCLLQGSAFGHIYDRKGLPAVHIRLSLEQVQPFLNPAGPYGIYLNHKSGTTGEKLLEELLDEGEIVYAREMKEMKYDLLKQASKANVHKVSCSLIFDTLNRYTGKVCEYYFDGQGNLTTALLLRPQLDEKSTVTDSVVYTYHASGHLKSAVYYNNTNTPDLHLETIWNFDQRGNLLEIIGFSEGDKDFENYVYVGDRIFTDFYEENEQNLLFCLGSDLNEYVHDKLITVKMYNDQISHWQVEKSNGKIDFSRDGKIIISIMEEGGKPVSIVNSANKLMTTNMEYNNHGNPLRHERIGGGLKNPYVIHFEYNSKQLPVSISVSGEKKRYKITYE